MSVDGVCGVFIFICSVWGIYIYMECVGYLYLYGVCGVFIFIWSVWGIYKNI